MLYLIGLGLGDEKDITVKGLEIVRKCDRVYLEAYTSILGVSVDNLESFYGRPVIVADRDLVEQGSDDILKDAANSDVAFLVVGDPFGATTHTDLVIRARELNIKVQAVHNASIINAMACCGVQLYRFGEIVSICFFDATWRPNSFYEKIAYNRKGGLHTLCLLDIKVKEQSIENLVRNRKVYEPARYMSVNLALEQLLEVENELRQNTISLNETICVGLARVGHGDQTIIAGTISELLDKDFGQPLHSLIVTASDCHFMELEYLKHYAVNPQTFDTILKNQEEMRKQTALDNYTRQKSLGE